MINSDSPKRSVNCVYLQNDSCTHPSIAIGFFQPTCRLIVGNKCGYIKKHELKSNVETETNVLFRWFM